MTDKLSKDECLVLLCTRAAVTGELPKKSDFTEQEVARIKSYYGPWPRALEAAGLKSPKAEDGKDKNLEKRIRAKRRKTEATKKQN